jgi:hypothetical protein
MRRYRRQTKPLGCPICTPQESESKRESRRDRNVPPWVHIYLSVPRQWLLRQQRDHHELMQRRRWIGKRGWLMGLEFYIFETLNLPFFYFVFALQKFTLKLSCLYAIGVISPPSPRRQERSAAVHHVLHDPRIVGEIYLKRCGIIPAKAPGKKGGCGTRWCRVSEITAFHSGRSCAVGLYVAAIDEETSAVTEDVAASHSCRG